MMLSHWLLIGELLRLFLRYQLRHYLGTVQTQWNSTARMYAATAEIQPFDVAGKVLVSQKRRKHIVAGRAIQRASMR